MFLLSNILRLRWSKFSIFRTVMTIVVGNALIRIFLFYNVATPQKTYAIKYFMLLVIFQANNDLRILANPSAKSLREQSGLYINTATDWYTAIICHTIKIPTKTLYGWIKPAILPLI